MKNLISIQNLSSLIHKEKVFSIGGGECSYEFYDSEGGFLFEVVVPNGTREGEQAGEGYEEQFEVAARMLTIHEKINIRGNMRPKEKFGMSVWTNRPRRRTYDERMTQRRLTQ